MEETLVPKRDETPSVRHLTVLGSIATLSVNPGTHLSILRALVGENPTMARDGQRLYSGEGNHVTRC